MYALRYILNLVKRLKNVNLTPEKERKLPEIHMKRFESMDSKLLASNSSVAFVEVMCETENDSGTFEKIVTYFICLILTCLLFNMCPL